MDYFFSPLACSFAGHVIIREASLPIEMQPVSLLRKQTKDGLAFDSISTKSQVPVLRFDDGRILTENSVVLQVLADMAPDHGYLPARSSTAGQTTLEWLNFVASEVHKHCLYPIFTKGVPVEVRAWATENLLTKMAYVTRHLSHTPYLAGNAFLIADAYFGWALMLTLRGGLWEPQGDVLAYWDRLLARPAFTAAMEVEEELFNQVA
jgi:glutathione S-transferase